MLIIFITFCRLLDMFYAFFLFWPANVIPVWLMVTLLQLFIPLNMFLRSLCVGLKHYKIHIFASFVIIVGVAVNLGDLSEDDYKDDNSDTLKYTFLFMLNSVFDVISHAIKEGLVRSQPLN